MEIKQEVYWDAFEVSEDAFTDFGKVNWKCICFPKNPQNKGNILNQSETTKPNCFIRFTVSA